MTSRRKPDPRQAALPFGAIEAHRRENIDILKRLAKVLDLRVEERELLVRITTIESGPKNEPLRKTYAQLGCKQWGMGCSARTAFSAVKRLKELCLITVTTVKKGDGQRPNEYRIDWAGVREAFNEEAEPGCNSCRPRSQNLQTQVANPSDPGRKICNHSNNLPSFPPLIPSPSSSTNAQVPKAATAADDFLKAKPEDFDALVGLVANCGVDRCFDVVSKAIARGDDVRAIVEAWRSRAKGWKRPAAKLALRLRDGRPGCTPDQGWPELDFPEKVLPRPTATPTRPANASSGETNKESTARREAIFGAILDAMSIDSRLALLTESEITVLGKAVSRGGARNFLLERLEGRQGATKQVEARAGCVSPGNVGAGRSAEHFAGSRSSAHERGPPAMEEMRFARSDPSGSPAVA